jgi:hypothetical protein
MLGLDDGRSSRDTNIWTYFVVVSDVCTNEQGGSVVESTPGR